MVTGLHLMQRGLFGKPVLGDVFIKDGEWGVNDIKFGGRSAVPDTFIFVSLDPNPGLTSS